ncbi:hypothetical protein DY000_02036475 [Brassica cretica]|uniref:Prolyl 4-hydroxylase alpha subunit domain-containing protein n=1 Tax=Brassica cretica TaxID=69181 RepID=A0ABQ7BIJ5_BRACR|nr:hypothetical protein DY000_02036475 [Brassica cretica]
MEKVDASLRFPHERWPEVISMKPRAFLYHNFVKNEECEHLISLAKPKMVRSIVSNAITGVQGVSSGRTSTGSFVSRGHDKIVEEIENRISEFTFLPVDVDEGGETVFPKSSGGLSVSPKKGDAVLFWNNRPDGSHDPSSLHAGRPVIKGNKWASTKLFHSQEFKCSYPKHNNKNSIYLEVFMISNMLPQWSNPLSQLKRNKKPVILSLS